MQIRGRNDSLKRLRKKSFDFAHIRTVAWHSHVMSGLLALALVDQKVPFAWLLEHNFASAGYLDSLF